MSFENIKDLNESPKRELERIKHLKFFKEVRLYGDDPIIVLYIEREVGLHQIYLAYIEGSHVQRCIGCLDKWGMSWRINWVAGIHSELVPKNYTTLREAVHDLYKEYLTESI